MTMNGIETTAAGADGPREVIAAAGLEAGYDECRTAEGAVRPHWSRVLGHVQQLDAAERTEHTNAARRILRNHGVTYNVAAGESSSERAWELDVLPFVVDASEWETLKAGVIQRAKLANLVLHDLYSGPQFLLRNGMIPPALVLANPSFLRCCRGIPVPGDTFLHLQAFDLARSPSGQWWILDTRTQTPKGVGYAIENRTIVGRVFQSLFRELRVEPVNRFFTRIRDNLVDLAPSATNWPRVVLLTPGVHSTAYYEHALLARYLGYTLVEGADLTVRDGRVHLKTVEGPQAVDVILRYVDDAYCDPLELRSDSVLGVPGLVHAARSGKVLLANALGSALMETPALQTALPELCRYLLKEDLRLPAAPTWWCGEPYEWETVAGKLDQMIIKNTFPAQGRRTRSGAELSATELESLREEIRQQPHDYVGQTPIQLSRAPVWSSDSVDMLPVVLRVYVAANGDSYDVLPGGLTKVSNSPYSPVRGFQLAGGSKDTWILGASDAPAAPSIKLESRPAARVLTGVPSRSADNFFWMGRYAERLENLIRMLRSAVSRLVDEPEPRIQQQAIAIAELLGRFGFHPQSSPFDGSLFQSEQLVLAIAYDPSYVGGIDALCRRTLTIVNSVRDRFSGDAWRVLSRLRDFPGPRPEHFPLSALQQRLHELLGVQAALIGIQTENMVRGPEWRFLNVGRRLERAQNLCHLLHSLMEHPEGLDLLLNPVLEISDSSMSYRRQFYSEPEPASVLEELLLNEQNPRSLRFNINSLLELCRGLPQLEIEEVVSDHEVQIRRIRRTLNRKSVLQMFSRDADGRVTVRPARLRRWHGQLSSLSDSVTRQYFSLLKSRASLHELSAIPYPA